MNEYNIEDRIGFKIRDELFKLVEMNESTIPNFLRVVFKILHIDVEKILIASTSDANTGVIQYMIFCGNDFIADLLSDSSEREIIDQTKKIVYYCINCDLIYIKDNEN